MRQEGGPSIEDILGSIKRVMARENRDLAESLHQPDEGKAHEHAGGEAETSEPAPESADAEEAEDVLDLSEFDTEPAGEQVEEAQPYDNGFSDDPSAEAQPEGEEAAADPTRDPVDGDPVDEGEPLTSEGAAEAMRQSLESLAMIEEAGATPRSLRANGTSLENMVRAMLRPMLAQWLEDNLPEIVERQVQAEIARIMSKQG